MHETAAHIPARSRRFRPMAILGAVVVLAIGTAFLALPRIERGALIRAGDADRATLRLATEVLRGALERTEALPALIAERPILAQLLRDPDNSGLVPYTNELLRQSALSLDVSDIYVMDAEGTTIAASNYRSDASFVGQNFSYRPYFTDAMSAGFGRFHAFGTTSARRGYFFAAPVIADTERLGAVAVKITLDRFEETWANAAGTIIVTDVNNIIFLSDRPEWHFRSLGPLSEPAIETVATTRQYPLGRLSSLPARETPLSDALDILEITDPETGTRETFVFQTALIAAPGWRVSLLTPVAPALSQAWTALAGLILVIVVLGLVAAVILQRRAQLIERIAQQRFQAEELEARVRARTLDLDAANRRLTEEVEDRRAAEDRLRRTQAELVQAGKLAALGQMSAALSHEFNQPLAAVKAYAENAGTFLDRGRVEDARVNVTRISGMADRMAAISKHLRNFARRPQETTGPVPLRAVIDDALELMQARLAKAGAAIDYAPPASEIWVSGGRVRLQQVVVNLIGNALDAMEGVHIPRIEIGVATGDGRARITVRDHGPGLSADALAQAFDPFFTTKGPGHGLGLGLSISYNIVRDFDGRLSAANHDAGGAVFTVMLNLTDPPGLPSDTDLAAE